MEQKMFILTWSANCFIIANSIDNQAQASTIPDTKTLDPVVTLSTQDNINFFQHIFSAGVFLGLGVLAHFGSKIRKEKFLKLIKALNYNKPSCITFCVKMF